MFLPVLVVIRYESVPARVEPDDVVETPNRLAETWNLPSADRDNRSPDFPRGRPPPARWWLGKVPQSGKTD